MGKKRKAYKIIFEKFERNKPFGKSSRTWEDNIRMSLKETFCKEVDWIHVPQDRNQRMALANMVMNLWISLKPENFLTS
jgi:hypothetical protein